MTKIISLSLSLVLTTWVAHAETLVPMTVDEARNFVENQTSTEVAEVLSQTPQRYDFVGPNGQSSTHYSGQVHRQVLMHDLKLYMGSYRRGQKAEQAALDELYGYYTYEMNKNGFKPFQVQLKKQDGSKALAYEGLHYASIYNGDKNLQEKVAGKDKVTLFNGKFAGWSKQTIGGMPIDRDDDGQMTPDELFRTMLDVVAKNASSGTDLVLPNGEAGPQTIERANVTEEIIDLAELTQKLLYSALCFSQAAQDYLSVGLGDEKGLQADNEVVNPKTNDTTLQHHWDEAFGYFGAARNYLEYSDEEIRAGVSIDAYKSEDIIDDQLNFLYIDQKYGTADRLVSLMAEKNLGPAVYASKIDLAAKDGQEDFTRTIMTYYLKGRHLLQEKPVGYLKQAQAYSVLLLHEWERLFAATSLHYLNEVLEDYEKYGSAKFSYEDMAHHYGELKGYSLAFQFNPSSVMTADEFENLHKLIADQPVRPDQNDPAQYIENLKQARQFLIDKYNFSQINGENW